MNWSLLHARNRVDRRPVGRRGQGQGDGPAGRTVRLGRPLPGRQQRRPHRRHAGRSRLRAEAHPVRDPVPGREERDRQRGRREPRGADRGEGGPGAARRRHLRPADLGRLAPDHAVPRGDRPRHRALPGQGQDRHHRPRHRPGVPGQGRPGRRPRRGPARREDPAPEGRGRARAEEPDPGQGLQPARAGLQRGRRHRLGAVEGVRRQDRRHPAAPERGPGARRDAAAGGSQGTLLDVDHGTYPS